MDNQNSLEYLADIQREAADNPNPKLAAEQLLNKLVSRFGADFGQIYRLDLSRGAYVPFASFGGTSPPLSIKSVEERDVRPEYAPLLGAVRQLKTTQVA